MPPLPREGVYACIADGELVFLDLVADRYRWAASECAEAILLADRGSSLNGPQATTLEPLYQAGLLVEAIGSETFANRVVTRRQMPIDLIKEPEPPISGSRFIQALWCQAITVFRLKHAPLHQIVAQLAAKKANLTGGPATTDQRFITRMTATFMATRHVFATQDRCLRASLALTSFMIAHNIPVTLVFGVRMRPFAAHAWVEWDGFVLNDKMDRISPYTPIMAV